MNLNDAERLLKSLNTGDRVVIDGREHLKTCIGRIPYYVDLQTGEATTGPQFIERAMRRREEIDVEVRRPHLTQSSRKGAN